MKAASSHDTHQGRALFHRVLIVACPPEGAEQVLERVAPLVDDHGIVRVLRVVDDGSPRDPHPSGTRPPIRAPQRRVRVTREAASTAEALEATRTGQYDLVALPWRGGSGGTPARRLIVDLLRRCPIPVWMVREGSGTAMRRVLTAIDPGQDGGARRVSASALVRLGADLAAAWHAQLHVLHVWNAFGVSLLEPRLSPDELRAYVDSTRARVDAAVRESVAEAGRAVPPERVHLVPGEFYLAVPDLVLRLGIDVVVMGTRGRSSAGMAFLLTPTVETVLDTIPCSLLVAKTSDVSTRAL